MTELLTSLEHKENAISQLKSQLEYQCLGMLIDDNILKYLSTILPPPQNTSQITTRLPSVPPGRKVTLASEVSQASPERRE